MPVFLELLHHGLDVLASELFPTDPEIINEGCRAGDREHKSGEHAPEAKAERGSEKQDSSCQSEGQDGEWRLDALVADGLKNGVFVRQACEADFRFFTALAHDWEK